MRNFTFAAIAACHNRAGLQETGKTLYTAIVGSSGTSPRRGCRERSERKGNRADLKEIGKTGLIDMEDNHARKNQSRNRAGLQETGKTVYIAIVDRSDTSPRRGWREHSERKGNRAGLKETGKTATLENQGANQKKIQSPKSKTNQKTVRFQRPKGPKLHKNSNIKEQTRSKSQNSIQNPNHYPKNTTFSNPPQPPKSQKNSPS